MQEKKILPRRKGVVLLSVLGCLFVFFAKTEKDLASSGNILWTAGYIGSTLLWTVVLGCLLDFLEPGWCIDFGTGHRPPKTPGKSRLHGMPAFPPGCSAAPVCRYFSEVCCFCCWPGCRYIWHIIPESVPMMHRCRRDRSWNIIISIITPLCTLCFCRGCCGWEVISSAV